MDHIGLAKYCKALGDPTRAHIFQFLTQCCCQVALDEGGEVRPFSGATAGEVCCHITGGEKVTSTISFHLKELREAGLINMEKSGKFYICSINASAVSNLVAHFESIESSLKTCC